jgi:glutathione S-transferase
MNLSLYYAPLTCALVPYVMLTEAGASFEVHAVNSRAGGTRTTEFLKVNPKHKVPVLVIDGEPLTENIAIQIWIARQFPVSRLLPTGREEIRALSWMSWCASSLHAHLVPFAHPQRFCDLPNSSEHVKHAASKTLAEDLAFANESLRGKEWLFDTFTAPDAYLFWGLRRAQTFGFNLTAYPHCMAHFERVACRASVRKLLAYDEALLREYGRA